VATAYDLIGRRYATHRRPEPRFAEPLWRALGNARRILNVGAGTGSYEPPTASVRTVAVEPSAVMLAQRPAGAAPAVQAAAESLPFAGGAFDAVMAVLTVHHWSDWHAGLAELRQIAPRRVVLAYDVPRHNSLWLLADYLPSVAERELRRSPSIEEIADGIEADRVEVLPIPHDCIDGMTTAYWRRPEAYLDPVVRACCSGLAQADPALLDAAMARLAGDLRSGRWRARYGHLLELDELDLGYRLLSCG
jgi:SAM-dependent methyltransferase